MNNLENKYILSEELIVAIDRILEKVPHVVFGGSIALNAVGLISRKINDVDIFLPMNENFKQFLSIGVLDEMTSDTVTDMNGKEIQRVGAKINDVKVCCFKVGDEELEHSNFTFFNRKIKIQNVNYAIIAKKTYSKKNKKHRDDLDEIYNSLHDLPF